MKVVHVKSNPFTHYIGRGWMPKVPAGHVQPLHARLGNPMVMNKESERDTVVNFFEDWVRNDPGYVAQGMRDRIKALPEDAVLGCWCTPRKCHGDVIVKLWKELNA